MSPQLEPARWWTLRHAQNRKPATYRCPLCGHRLHAMSPHVLLAPEGDSSRRRHAHAECAQAAREQGRLPTRDEWRRTQPRGPGLLDRILGRRRAPTSSPRADSTPPGRSR